MSFLVGSLAGGLVAGGVYYGFSNLMLTRTVEHRLDMHVLSQRLVGASSTVPSPPSAATRITHRPFASLLKDKWNQQTATVVEKVHAWDGEVQEWGRKVLYGLETTRKE
ncbi:hypothetical protein FIBSPDRAFT_747096 [Athelia psychrophila]|uniref:MICOS complex subunit MIC12 n=1 Tax=Athelia psychrophila TaxID=1759441 RepID=A0A166G1J4_9AGAM|nr:hypothetical protein FIBSPDRAFT_747096 [Fibularhizoctonia sp. CBS 109695]